MLARLPKRATCLPWCKRARWRLFPSSCARSRRPTRRSMTCAQAGWSAAWSLRHERAAEESLMKIAVMGPGGVGGYFGARLAAAKHDVTFVARGAHLEAMRGEGLRLDSEIGGLTLPVKVAAHAREIAAADAIMFTVKLGDTEAAAEQLRGLVAQGATVFTFQNGVESAERIGKVLGAESVVAGAARINAQISAPGVIRQQGKFAVLEFGEADGRESLRTTALLAACKQAGITASLSDDISRTLWLKFAMLAPMSGLTALTRGPIGPVRAHPESRRLIEAAVREAVAVGIAQGVRLEPVDADA